MSDAKRRKWLQPGFLVVIAILAITAVGLNAAISLLQLRFQKQPVELAKPLTSIPEKLGPWLQVSHDGPLDKETEDALATQQYVFRDYVDTRKLSKDELAGFDGKNIQERKLLLAQIQAKDPEAVINMAVTYYTGGVDTVAHIPERCYVADGYQPSETPETAVWNTGSSRLGNVTADQNVGVRFIHFEDETAAGRVTRRVAYFFFADGVYKSNPIDVRTTLQNLRFKHGFYSKVELATIVKEHDACARVMTDFLTYAMPFVEQCYPDWDAVENGKIKVASAK